jgi:hypothetical protein
MPFFPPTSSTISLCRVCIADFVYNSDRFFSSGLRYALVEAPEKRVVRGVGPASPGVLTDELVFSSPKSKQIEPGVRLQHLDLGVEVGDDHGNKVASATHISFRGLKSLRP